IRQFSHRFHYRICLWPTMLTFGVTCVNFISECFRSCTVVEKRFASSRSLRCETLPDLSHRVTSLTL
ncbi:MAG: hypothetical protein V3S51_02835, partial [Dehalococcoidia bacterium]